MKSNQGELLLDIMACLRRSTAFAALVCLFMLSASVHADSFTFIAWSDTHYGWGEGEGNRDDAIGDINGLAGTPYPAPFTGIVAPPAFVVHAGDITQWGLLTEWQNATPSTDDDYVSGRALLQFPSYEVIGNHDHRTDIIRAKFVEEHGNPWYSFDYGGVHFVMLDSQDEIPEPGIPARFGPEQRAWLAADLAAVGTTKPVIAVMHYQPVNDGREEGFDALADLLAGYNIVLIMHGHLHVTVRNVWRGWDVWGIGHVKDRNAHSTIAAVRISQGRLQVIPYNWYYNQWYSGLYIDKPITGLPPGPPHILLQPASTDVTTTFEISPANSTFSVTNVGDLTLNYTITDDADWLSVSPENGSSMLESDIIQVSYDVTGLNIGPHSATITVEDPNASNSPQTISVNLLVKPIPGDFDGDMDVDQEDFGLFQACFGPLTEGCEDANLNSDGKVDQGDFTIFYNCMSGPNVLADPNCAA